VTTIRIHGLEIFTSVGVTDAERATGHRLRFDLALSVPVAPGACITDDIAETTNYGSVMDLVADLAARQSWATLEFLAQSIGDRVLADFPEVGEVEVLVTKPLPPVAHIVAAVSVTRNIKRATVG
jgi:dihydroneopterin aldolase